MVVPDSFIFTETLSQLNLSDTYPFLYQAAIIACIKIGEASDTR